MGSDEIIEGSDVSAQPGADRTTGRGVSPRPFASTSEPEHNTDSPLCWCGPTRDPIDPEVIIHRVGRTA